MLEAESFGKPTRKGHAGRSCTGLRATPALLLKDDMAARHGPRLGEPSSTISAHCTICLDSSSEPRGDRRLAGNSLLQSYHHHRRSSLVGLPMFSRASSRGVVCKGHQCPEDRMTLAISLHLLRVAATILLGPCVWPLQMGQMASGVFSMDSLSDLHTESEAGLGNPSCQRY